MRMKCSFTWYATQRKARRAGNYANTNKKNRS